MGYHDYLPLHGPCDVLRVMFIDTDELLFCLFWFDVRLVVLQLRDVLQRSIDAWLNLFDSSLNPHRPVFHMALTFEDGVMQFYPSYEDLEGLLVFVVERISNTSQLVGPSCDCLRTRLSRLIWGSMAWLPVEFDFNSKKLGSRLFCKSQFIFSFLQEKELDVFYFEFHDTLIPSLTVLLVCTCDSTSSYLIYFRWHMVHYQLCIIIIVIIIIKGIPPPKSRSNFPRYRQMPLIWWLDGIFSKWKRHYDWTGGSKMLLKVDCWEAAVHTLD